MAPSSGSSFPTLSSAKSLLELIGLARQGIQKNAVMNIARELALTTPELLNLLHVSERTWQRYTDTRLLPQDMTERALQLASLYERGIETFGNVDKFKGWMQHPNPVFGGIKPVDLLDSLYGFRAIEDELIRIEHGVLA